MLSEIKNINIAKLHTTFPNIGYYNFSKFQQKSYMISKLIFKWRTKSTDESVLFVLHLKISLDIIGEVYRIYFYTFKRFCKQTADQT